jgi:hypothetical protein
MKMNWKNIMVFDVESNGLYGEGFAVGAVVSDCKGNILDKLELKSAEGEQNVTSNWVKENVLPHLGNMPVVQTNIELREAFYKFYMKHKDTCVIYSDVNYPVETNFLTAVVNDNLSEREFIMPCPLMDIANVNNIDIDRIKFYEKKNAFYIAQSPATRKLRKHNPLDDAIASLCLKLDKKIYYDIK